MVIFGGIRSIAKVAELVVPLMAGAYLLLALWVIGHNIEHMPAILALIFKSAFGLQEAAAGAVGYGISQAMTQGVQRGLFSNEAGMGSAPNAAASASPYPPHPASQGYVQMLGVFIDTIVICSATAAIILSSGILDQPTDSISGIDLTQRAVDRRRQLGRRSSPSPSSSSPLPRSSPTTPMPRATWYSSSTTTRAA